MARIIYSLGRTALLLLVFYVVFLTYPINPHLQPFTTCELLLFGFLTPPADLQSLIVELYLAPFKLILQSGVFSPSLLGYSSEIDVCKSNVPVFVSAALWGGTWWLAPIIIRVFELHPLPKKDMVQPDKHKDKLDTKAPAVAIEFSNNISVNSIENGYKAWGSLRASDKREANLVIKEFFNCYPRALVESCVSRILVVKYLSNADKVVGGFASSQRHEIVVSANESNFQFLNRFLHHELAHILLQRFPPDRAAWLNAVDNSALSYAFDTAGTHTLNIGKRSFDKPEEYFKNGFLREYGASCFEEDFCVYAEFMLGDPKTFLMFQKYPLVREKTKIILDYYRRLDVQIQF